MVEKTKYEIPDCSHYEIHFIYKISEIALKKQT